VVRITTQLVESGVEERSLGSGVLIDDLGHIVTNYHVVEDAAAILVALADGIPMTAQLVGVDEKTDLAVLQVSKKNLPFLTMGDAAPIRVGDWVLAIGYPFGVGQSTTIGIVSATERVTAKPNLEELFQTDAALNKGNSGGALINSQGKLIGISSAYLSKDAEGINFGIPISLTKFVVEHIIRDGKVVRGWLGVKSGSPLSPLGAQKLGIMDLGGGILIRDLYPDSPATEAGLQVGDIILKVNGGLVGDPNRLVQWLSRMEPNTRLLMDVLRPAQEGGKNKSFQTSLVLAKKPENVI